MWQWWACAPGGWLLRLMGMAISVYNGVAEAFPVGRVSGSLAPRGFSFFMPLEGQVSPMP